MTRDEAAERFLDELSRATKDGRAISEAERIATFKRFAEAGKLVTLEPLLPILLSLKGKPYTLERHFPFAPVFRCRIPRRLVLKTARQVSKSTSLAASGIVFSNAVPNVTTLYVTPLFEQIRKFSANYVGAFINQSPVKLLWSDTSTINSVLQRSFKNQSMMLFSFAADSPDRCRGVSADINNFDECQNLDRSHIEIIEESMSHSVDWGISRYTGTPLTLDNCLESFWQRSSMAEWFIPCYACGSRANPTWNIPALEYHLFEMIGPYRADISETAPAVVCHKCRRPINPRQGRWVHRHKERRWEFAGYHVPQIIMPLHYGHPEKWAVLLGKREHMATNVFLNEVLGESYDIGSKLVTLTELNDASCLPWKNTWQDPSAPPDEDALRMLAQSRQYEMLVLGIDWGGGGQEEISYTALALIGFAGGGRCDVLWGKKLLTPNDGPREATEIYEWCHKLRPHLVAHDYTGAGTWRETFLFQAGIPLERIVPIRYVGAASKGPMNLIPATDLHPRDHYSADKTRTLQYTTGCVKIGAIRFFRPDYKNDDNPGLIRQFLALVSEKTETRLAGDIYVIRRQEGFSDDFTHAVNLACATAWNYTGSWPNFASMMGYAPLTPTQMTAVAGHQELGWDDPAESFNESFHG